MGKVWRRWRAPLLGGIALWLMTVPLLLSHPASAAPQAARGVKDAGLVVSERQIVRQLVQRQASALAASTVVAALVTSSPAVSAPGVAPISTAPAAPAPARPAPAAVHANNIVIPRLGLNQPVGWYSDCLGRAAVPRWGTWRWSCAGANNIYVMAHNPGIFTPILALHAGDIVEYGDPSGRVHTYRVTSTTIVSNTQLWPLGSTAQSTLTLQTCWTWDGSRDFIVRAVEI
ncbi:MAG TPA: sortase [Candidatus Dormibacteraeota bacterium]